jgi:hypothetical protein
VSHHRGIQQLEGEVQLMGEVEGEEGEVKGEEG